MTTTNFKEYAIVMSNYSGTLICNEGPRDWQSMFAITRFCCIKVLFSIVYRYWGHENRLLYWGLCHIRGLLNQGSTVFPSFQR